LFLWPGTDQEAIPHRHPGLSDSDPHWKEGAPTGGHRHAHAFIIDDLHPQWPREP
jgi:hypothetical protein